MISVRWCPGNAVDQVWDDVAPILERSLARGCRPYTLDDIRGLIRSGNRLLLLAWDDDEIIGTVVAMLVTYPRRKELFISYLAGDRGIEWKDPMEEALEAVCHHMDCAAIEFRGRDGWGKVLQADGYKAVATVYRKELANV